MWCQHDRSTGFAIGHIPIRTTNVRVDVGRNGTCVDVSNYMSHYCKTELTEDVDRYLRSGPYECHCDERHHPLEGHL